MSDAAVEAKALRNTPFFSGLSDEDVSEIIAMGEQASFAEGEHIVTQGDVGDAMYVLLEGTAEVDVGGRFHRLHAGQFVGEMALMSSGRRLATVKATSPVGTLRIPGEGFRAFLLGHPQIAVSMLEALSERLREVEQRFEAWMT
ncbi:MAG: cyclic nucleotide-binding domain-containing protein [Actinomycetota bacterium]